MSVLRQLNILGQMRLDVPHLRSIESSIAADFDVVSGRITAGQQALVVRGFTLANFAGGTAATSIQLATADSILLNVNASEAGTFLWVPATQPVDTLNPATNPNIIGGFTASQTNYIGLDLIRVADPTTSDLVQFLDPNTLLEDPKNIPLGRILNYQIVIGTTPFSAQPNVVPIAKVVTDSTNNISTITPVIDARNMLFRLGNGGDFPNPAGFFSWPQGRSEVVSGVTAFQGGDKGIQSQKDWNAAVMTRVWEIGGGENWYRPTADRNVTMVWVGSTFSDGENFEWTGTNLHWKGLKFIFDNSTGFFNDVQDQITDNPGQTDLADGQCIYVDLDRSLNHTGGTALVAAKATLTTLGPGSIPGARNIIAWRIGANIYTRNWRYAVGTTFTPATATSLGVVKLSRNDTTPLQPVVISDAGGTIVAPGGSGLDGLDVSGDGASNGIVGNSSGAWKFNAGVVGVGGSGNTGAEGVQGQGTFGVHGICVGTDIRAAVWGEATNRSAGVVGTGWGVTSVPTFVSFTNGAGVVGFGGTNLGMNSPGGEFTGGNAGDGVHVTGGASAGQGLNVIGGTNTGAGTAGGNGGTILAYFGGANTGGIGSPNGQGGTGLFVTGGAGGAPNSNGGGPGGNGLVATGGALTGYNDQFGNTGQTQGIAIVGIGAAGIGNACFGITPGGLAGQFTGGNCTNLTANQQVVTLPDGGDGLHATGGIGSGTTLTTNNSVTNGNGGIGAILTGGAGGAATGNSANPGGNGGDGSQVTGGVGGAATGTITNGGTGGNGLTAQGGNGGSGTTVGGTGGNGIQATGGAGGGGGATGTAGHGGFFTAGAGGGVGAVGIGTGNLVGMLALGTGVAYSQTWSDLHTTNGLVGLSAVGSASGTGGDGIVAKAQGTGARTGVFATGSTATSGSHAGGAGMIANGGAGFGTSQNGGNGIQGLGGAPTGSGVGGYGGTFTAGSNQSIACAVPNNQYFGYTSTVTRTLHMDMSEFNGGPGGASSYDQTAHVLIVKSTTGSSPVFEGHVRVPAGATITDFQVLANNVNATNDYDIDAFGWLETYNSGGDYTETAAHAGSFNTYTIPHNTSAYAWYNVSSGSWTALTVPANVSGGAEGWFSFYFTTPVTGGAGDIRIKAWRVIYTQTQIAPTA